ncbi:MAG: CotH kinase family protein, partial [Anaerolineales bacterium]|nr:CotH kinase family protein [Anaerolineales bacterium]
FRPATINGRWRWIIWDNDLSLGLTPWSNVGQNTLEQALDPAYTAGVAAETDGRDTILLRGLLQNPAFRARFIARADELLNTVLAPEAVIAVIDRLAAEIKPAIALENGRWGGDTATWEANVEQLRDFARQRPAIMRQHFAESLP